MENSKNSIFTELQTLMQVEPEMRKPDQIQRIEALLLNFPFFKQLKREFHVNNVVDCAIYFTYQHFRPKQTIFEPNQFALKFFILLEGEVSIFKDNTQIRIYKEGPFEECCLAERRKYDNLAVSTKESHIISVDYQIYAGLFMSNREKRRIAMASFLQIQKEFKGWSKAKLMSLSYFINEFEAPPGSQVFNVGDPCDKIFVVQDGSVVLKTNTVQMFGVGDVIGITDLNNSHRRSVCISHGITTLLYIFKYDYIENLKTLPKSQNFKRIVLKPKKTVKNMTISIHSFVPELPKQVILSRIGPIRGSSRPSSHNSNRAAYGRLFSQRNHSSFQMRNTARGAFY